LFLYLIKQPNPSSESDAAKARRASILRDVYTCEHNQSKKNFMKTESNTNLKVLRGTLSEAGLLDWQGRYIWKKMPVFPAGIFTFWKKIHYSIFGFRSKRFTGKFPEKREVH
jgi:hypothetical protein